MFITVIFDVIFFTGVLSRVEEIFCEENTCLRNSTGLSIGTMKWNNNLGIHKIEYVFLTWVKDITIRQIFLHQWNMTSIQVTDAVGLTYGIELLICIGTAK